MQFRLALTLFSILFILSSCVIPIIVPVPATPVQVSIFYNSHKDYFKLYEGKVDEGNKLVKAWDTYSVEATPKKDLIVKVYNHDLGVLMAKITYKDSELLQRTGKMEEWSDSGNKLYEGYYMNNMKVHKWKFYDLEKGYVLSEGKYMNGKKRGLWKEYNEQGELVKEEEYKRPVEEEKESEEEGFEFDEDLYSQLIFAGCQNKETLEDQVTCTNHKLNNLRKEIYFRFKNEKVSRIFLSVLLIKVDEEGETIIEIIRSVNNNAKAIIEDELNKRDLKFTTSKENEPSENGDTFFLLI